MSNNSYRYVFRSEDLEPIKPKPKVRHPNSVKCPFCCVAQRFPDTWLPDDFLEKIHIPKCKVAKRDRKNR